MLNRLTKDATHIYLAVGVTDFRKQITGLVSMIQVRFGEDPFMDTRVFIFCNKKKDSIKTLRYDKNGFVLADKKLLEKMKFQWPKDTDSVKEVSVKEVEWLLEGLSIEQKKAHHEVKISTKNSCF